MAQYGAVVVVAVVHPEKGKVTLCRMSKALEAVISQKASFNGIYAPLFLFCTLEVGVGN